MDRPGCLLNLAVRADHTVISGALPKLLKSPHDRVVCRHPLPHVMGPHLAKLDRTGLPNRGPVKKDLHPLSAALAVGLKQLDQSTFIINIPKGDPGNFWNEIMTINQ